MPRKSAVTDLDSPSLPDELWDLQRAMEFFKTSKTGLYALMSNEGLPFVKMGRHRVFDPRDVAEWWEKRRRQQIA